MKKFLSKLIMIALVLTVLMGISSVAYAYDDADIISVNEQYLNSWNSTDFNEYLKDESVNEESLEQFTNWNTLKNQLGNLVAIEGTEISESEGVVTAVTTASYENNKMIFTVTYDSAGLESYGAMYSIISLDAVAKEANAGSPNMGKAGMNTLMGMGIVFVVLIVISMVISLLKFIPDMIGKSKQKEALETDTVITTDGTSQENLMDDSELVAVISAAIMAAESETVQKGGLVVRSIRRKR